jgi:peptidoglycan/LPS O-acetylase OafA/YrhL
MCAHLLGPSLPEPIRYIFTGAPAVMAFFVVSGFCIHLPYREGGFQAVPFLSARAARIIIPATVAYLLAKAVGLDAYNPVDGFILWSIVCEAFYYAAYPMLRLITERTGWKRLTAASFVLAYAIALGVGSDAYGNIHVFGWYLNWLVMMPAWLVGVVLAHDFGRHHIPGSVWLWRAVTGLTAGFLYWATLHTRAGFYLTLNPLALLVAVWILAETQVPHPKWLERSGRGSYSLYLIHFIVAAFMGFPQTGPVLVIPCALAGSYLFYLAIERPAHSLARHIFRRLLRPADLSADVDI